MMIEITYLGRNRTITTPSVFMYDRGVRLKLLKSPEGSYRIDLEDGTILAPVDDVVTLPDSLFLQPGNAPLYIGVRDGESFNTLNKIVIPVLWRGKPPQA